jgi:hypothetical protein
MFGIKGENEQIISEIKKQDNQAASKEPLPQLPEYKVKMDINQPWYSNVLIAGAVMMKYVLALLLIALVPYIISLSSKL